MKTMKTLRLFLWLALAMWLLPASAQPQLIFATNNNSLTLIGYYGSETNLVIPSETNSYPVIGIADYVFQNHGEIINVVIPASVTNIGFGPFLGCAGVTNFQVDPTNPAFTDVGGILFDANQTTLVAFPEARSGTYAIPNTVTNINGAAFQSCVHLTSISLDPTIVTIGLNAFAGCNNLNGLVLPDGVKNIGDSAFGNCSGIPNIVIPDSVTNVGAGAFGNCSALTNAVIGRAVLTLGAGAFQNTPLRNIVIPDAVTAVSSGTFDNCTSLTNITIGQGVTSIGFNAFHGCSNLTSITLPSGVGYIGQNAFTWTKLARIAIPDATTNIDAWAFQNLPTLTNVVVGSGVATIGEGAFNNVSVITNVAGFFFKGNAPTAAMGPNIFAGYNQGTVYYLPGTTGWGTNFGGLPAVLWNPRANTTDSHFGVLTNRFGFDITGTTNIPIVVEASGNLTIGWTPLFSGNLTNGSVYFSDPQWINYSNRFYRIRSP